jgi:Flp pilus assembly protein TadG
MTMKAHEQLMTLPARFVEDRGGNVVIILALSILPMLLMAGVAIDYGRDAMVRGRMNAAADAAALAGTAPSLLAQSSSTAQAAATAMFAAQTAMVSGVVYDPKKLSVTVTDSVGANGATRQVVVSYPVAVQNFFGVLENTTQTNFTVASTASVSTAPNINFYMLLDASPSMEIPATTAGITTMVNNTGCALACHETDFKDSEYTKQYKGWGTIDSYTYAENNGIPLRIDNMRTAAQSLITVANRMMDDYNATAPANNQLSYCLSAHSFGDGTNQLFPAQTYTAPQVNCGANALTPSLNLWPASDSNVSKIQSYFSAVVPDLMSDNSYLATGASYTYPTSSSAYSTVTLTANTYNNDAGTNFNYALKTLNAAMPTPGGGTNKTGDLPQGVLLIVTDGVDDVALYNSSSCNTSQHWSFSNSYGSFTRCQQPVNTALCSTIKARGIRIAVLYTVYYPLTSNSWYTSTVAPFISQVQSNLQACASSANLFAAVSTDGDITAALQQLFINAVNTAPHLTQ